MRYPFTLFVVVYLLILLCNLQAGLPGGKTVTVKILKRKADAPIEPAKFMGSGLCDSFSRYFTTHSLLFPGELRHCII